MSKIILLLLLGIVLMSAFFFNFDNPKIKIEYYIEALPNDSAVISNGTDIDTIPFNDVKEWIIKDNQ